MLAGLLVPTTMAGHPFWNESDPPTRAQHRIQFLKNLAMVGRLLEVVAGGGSRHAEKE